MRQKIKLAQALAHDPDVIFLDEPLNGMDPVSRKQSIDLVQRTGRSGRTVLVSSHILPEVESMTSQIILIHRGKVLAEGDVAEIRDKIPEHPTIVALVSSAPRALAGVPDRPRPRRRRPGRPGRTASSCAPTTPWRSTARCPAGCWATDWRSTRS